MQTIASDELNRVLHLLPHGSERLITANEISQVTGISKRKVYNDIALLIDRYSVPIGGLRSEGQHGYFIITNEAERKHCLACKNIRFKCKNELIRLAISNYKS